MFKLNENYEVHRKLQNFDYPRYSPAETSTINTPTSQICNNKPMQDSVISFLKSYLELKLQVIKKTDNSRYANGNDIRLFDLGPIALFSNFQTRSGIGNTQWKATRIY